MLDSFKLNAKGRVNIYNISLHTRMGYKILARKSTEDKAEI
jgi:hypothetical protein